MQVNLTTGWAALVLIAAADCCVGQVATGPATGPLRAHPTNPRYFTDGTKNPDGALRAVYLTGSHTWGTLQDLGTTNPPPAFDFNAYLDFLQEHRHNFIRLWRWELTKWKGWKEDKAPIRYGAQHPWMRTGPGLALDGLPQFDLTKWNEEHFDRLRARVKAAGERGIYVSIMLFEGWCIRERPSNWEGHPMHAANNVNGINGDPDGDGFGLEVQMLQIDAITDLQRAYIRRVIDAVNDLDNVLYEISNESLYRPEILNWQIETIRYINEYQAGKPQQHPAGITNLVAGSGGKAAANDALFASDADWVSPGLTIWGPTDPFTIDPPASTGKKVELLDTDHVFGNTCMTNSKENRVGGAWVWKAFLRGYNPIYMDPLALSRPNAMMEYVAYNTPYVLSARTAMGHARLYAEKINLAAMTPQDALASSRYCLANPGKEYLIYLPDGGEVTADLSAVEGSVMVEWFNPQTAEKRAGDKVHGGAMRPFRAPFDRDAVLYLRRE
jgi:hypothetical protein